MNFIVFITTISATAITTKPTNISPYLSGKTQQNLANFASILAYSKSDEFLESSGDFIIF